MAGGHGLTTEDSSGRDSGTVFLSIARAPAKSPPPSDGVSAQTTQNLPPPRAQPQAREVPGGVINTAEFIESFRTILQSPTISARDRSLAGAPVVPRQRADPDANKYSDKLRDMHGVPMKVLPAQPVGDISSVEETSTTDHGTRSMTGQAKLDGAPRDDEVNA